jgi:hypothetical protein
MTPIGDLELNGAESIQAFLALFRTAAKHKNTGRVIRFSRYVPHREEQPILGVIVLGVNNTPAVACADHGAVRDFPRIGRDLDPTIEGFAVKNRLGLFEHSVGYGVGRWLLFGLLVSRGADTQGTADHCHRAGHSDCRPVTRYSHLMHLRVALSLPRPWRSLRRSYRTLSRSTRLGRISQYRISMPKLIPWAQ